MKFIPKIIPKKDKKLSRFVVVDIGLGRVNIAIFDTTSEGPKFVGVGRRSFTENDTILDATLEATDALGAIVDELPVRAIIGVSGGKLDTVSTIAKYTREKPKQPIDKNEAASVLEKVTGNDKEDLKVFFSTITKATIDEAKITNPIGVKGEKAEIACFVAFKPEDELKIYDQIIDELELKPEKIIPTSFAVAQMVNKNLTGNVLLLRIGQIKTEAAQIHEGNLLKVTNIDLGSEQLDYYNFALEALLEKQTEEERSNLVWLYSDTDEVDLEAVEEKLAKTDWKQKFNLKQELKLEKASGENNFGPSDMSLLSLSLQEILN